MDPSKWTDKFGKVFEEARELATQHANIEFTQVHVAAVVFSESNGGLQLCARE